MNAVLLLQIKTRITNAIQELFRHLPIEYRLILINLVIVQVEYQKMKAN